MVMTEEERSIAADEIEHRHFFVISAVIEIVARCAIEDDANAKKIQQPAQLRLDHLIEIIRGDRLHAASLLGSAAPCDDAELDRRDILRRAERRMKQQRGTPFETLESAYEFVSLLREAVDDAYASILEQTERAR